MTDQPDDERSAPTASTARHLADLEARYETHLAALRRRAADVQPDAEQDDSDPADP